MTNFYRVAKADILLANKPPTPGYHGRLQLQNLRMAFTIQKNLAWSTNSCSLRIWNLSADNRNQLKDYGDQVTLYAGYQDVLSQPIYYTGNTSGTQLLFRGDTTNVRHSFDYPDIVTVIECGDGERYVNQKLIEITFKESDLGREEKDRRVGFLHGWGIGPLCAGESQGLRRRGHLLSEPLSRPRGFAWDQSPSAMSLRNGRSQHNQSGDRDV